MNGGTRSNDPLDGKTDMRSQALDIARRLFVEEGYASFSMRRVARELGIRQGHLQHYFATRDDLLTEMLEQALHSYTDEYQKVLDDLSGDAEQQLDRAIKFLVGDISNNQVSKFFFELWPMTAHYREVLLMLRDIYRKNWEGFSLFVENYKEGMEKDRARSLALMILALIDGLIIYAHSTVPTKRELDRAKADAYSTIWAILRAA